MNPFTHEEPFRLPIDGTLDLHAFSPADTRAVVADYLEAAVGKGLQEIRVVHGRGSGTRRALVQRLLTSHSLVAEFWDDPRAHLGATVVKLRSA